MPATACPATSACTASPSPPRSESEAWLLPAPLRRRQTLTDPTAWMGEAATPEGAIRIGLAHGSVTRFGSADRSQGNYIDPARPKEARLDYLALGDWHGQRQIGPRCWYAGTPEPDDFDQEDGAVLLVEIAGPGAVPAVQSLPTARYRWVRQRETLHGAEDIAVLDERIRALAPDAARLLVDLVVEGTLSLADRALFAQRIDRSLRAALCHLRLDDERLFLAPSPHDLDAIAKAGFVRAAAARLKERGRRRGQPGARGRGRGADAPVPRAPEARVMKLCALELDQFRKFDRPVRIQGLSDGLNLIVGPNEMGKSTLLAALVAALFEKHRSSARTVQSFQPSRHRTAPRVSLDFEVDGKPYRIEKQFLKRPFAHLHLPDGARIDGDDAEAELERLLAFDQAGRRSDGDIWGVLWVAQGRSFDLPAFGDGARTTLQSCLDVELGQAIGDDRGPALLEAIETALLELVDRRGKPKARYLTLERELAELRHEIARLEGNAAELEQDLARLDQEQGSFEQLFAAEQAGLDPQALAAAREQRDGLMMLAARAREAKATETIARQALAQAEQQAAERAELVACAGGGEGADRGSRRRIRRGCEPGRRERRGARLAAGRGGAARGCSAPDQQHRSVGLKNLRRLMRQAEDSRAALDARATEVALTLEPDALARVQIGGRPADRRKQALHAVDPVEITIEGIGRIDIRPRVAQAARWRRDLADAEHQIAGLLRELGLAPADEAPTGAGQLSLFAPRSGQPPDPAALEGLLAETERQSDALLAQIEAARAELAQRDESHRRQAFAATQAKERVEQTQQELERLERGLAEAEEVATQTELADAVVAARTTLDKALAEVARLAEGDPATALAAVEGSIGQLEQAIEDRRARLGALRGSIEGLQARVRLHAGEGFAERLDVARRRLAEAEREHAKCRREALVLQLLQRTLGEAEREAKERYLAPVVERIRPYLQALFPGAEIALDEALRITSVRRGGVGEEPFEQLSEGTREQIAILVRLALAELLCDRGLPAVVVLDDALVFSDDLRMQRMFRVLERAAERLQILMLTCRERLFEDLAGTRLHLEPAGSAGEARGAA